MSRFPTVKETDHGLEIDLPHLGRITAFSAAGTEGVWATANRYSYGICHQPDLPPYVSIRHGGHTSHTNPANLPELAVYQDADTGELMLQFPAPDGLRRISYEKLVQALGLLAPEFESAPA